MKSWQILCLLICLAPMSWSKDLYSFDNSVNRERFKHFTEQMRCPTCQNETIADSQALVSQTLRQDIYEQIKAGRSDKEITDYMVARYGNYILYRPRFNRVTAVLWVAPLALLTIGVVVLLLLVRKRRAKATDTDSLLSADERKQIAQILDRDNEQSEGKTS